MHIGRQIRGVCRPVEIDDRGLHSTRDVGFTSHGADLIYLCPSVAPVKP